MTLQGLKGISDEALCAVLSVVRDLPPDDDVDLTTRHVSDFLKSEFSKVSRTLHVATAAGNFDWEVADVSKLLQYFVDESTYFKAMLMISFRG